MLGRGLPPFGVGIDICRISRIYKNLRSPLATKFVERILTPEELKVPFTLQILKCVFTPSPDLKDGRDPKMGKAAEFMAGRLVAIPS